MQNDLEAMRNSLDHFARQAKAMKATTLLYLLQMASLEVSDLQDETLRSDTGQKRGRKTKAA